MAAPTPVALAPLVPAPPMLPIALAPLPPLNLANLPPMPAAAAAAAAAGGAALAPIPAMPPAPANFIPALSRPLPQPPANNPPTAVEAAECRSYYNYLLSQRALTPAAITANELRAWSAYADTIDYLSSPPFVAFNFQTIFQAIGVVNQNMANLGNAILHVDGNVQVLAGNMNTMNNTFTNAFNNMQMDINGMRTDVQSLLAITRNMKIFKANEMRLDPAALNLACDPMLLAPVKEIPGAGAGIDPNAVPGPNVVATARTLAINVPLPPGFHLPATYAEILEQFTVAEINDLSILYNHDFGIVSGMLLYEQRHKLLQWLCGHY
jgi:hypothetical protein